ncbi:endonuclease/exonuclease/phosphatase family protein [Georgenia yuyongxinii]|nr:endonuclease/exonuclease/phosphatase family protein [Georgenia yuyongxinii]
MRVVVGWLLVLLLGTAAVLTLNPEWLARLNPDWAGLTTTYPISQVVALRPLLAAVFAVLALVVLAVGVFRRTRMRRGIKTLTLGLVLLAVAIGHAWVVWDRGMDNPGGLSADDGVRPAGAGTGAITVLTYNTLDGRTTAEDVADLAGQNGADIIALPETSLATAEEVAALMLAEGAPFQVFVDVKGEPAIGSTALLVASTLGEYVQTSAPETSFGAVRAEPASGVGPPVVAVHVSPPISRLTAQWQADLEAVTALCRGRDAAGLVVAGDLNATLDHRPLQDLGGCADAALAGGVGGVSTWPVRTPAWLGSAIDHVLVDTGRYRVTEAAVVQRGESDHRGVVARLLPGE